jgi:hypothetical protein
LTSALIEWSKTWEPRHRKTDGDSQTWQ